MPERNYTSSEIHTMQQDAIRRVMEMQRIANERLQRTNAARASAQQEHRSVNNSEQRRTAQTESSPQQSSQRRESTRENRHELEKHGDKVQDSLGHPAPIHHTMPVELSTAAHTKEQPSLLLSSGALEGFVKRLGLETDQLILLGLLLLLINEGADTILIMAVFYLLI